ncbi:uncharacterized protein Z518_05250 [Rhinocladiella mackenziei CBS 650.93]|uniref:Arabinan endo-1,5-alpha-L-arabinosidase n=1 Tax=Rhinocladiella mackenziei CBS 650.93 TaxID=1442369 RepID=A0A0D2FQA7_9EURO|nr:uncharacterized protein Z518_05250 [Rhinocladiella mackenziei CBS 650.93]KIX04382.1 hypothetical protein Z518_05250 [Rhinocladiella mackenziei CBS 650.93]
MVNSFFSLLSAIGLVKSSSISLNGTANNAVSNTNNNGNWPEPEPCTGNCTFIHDPSIIKREDGTFFRFSTNGNIAIASAPSMTGPWEYLGAMLPEGSVIQVTENQEIWCPDVFLINDTYYAYYAVSRSGLQSSDIGVATSKTLELGTWTDHGSLGLPKSQSYNLIDPNIFRESPSAPSIYFAFGSAWHGIYQTQLSWQNPLSQSDEIGSGAKNVAYNDTNPASSDTLAIVEGGFQFWWPVNDIKYYYLFFSSGACCNDADDLAAPGDEYKIMVCRAIDPIGPFVDRDGKDCATENGGTLLLGSHGDKVYAPGGQGVILDDSEDGMGRVVLYYHYVNPIIGYKFEDFQFGFNYLDFSSGWPAVVS